MDKLKAMFTYLRVFQEKNHVQFYFVGGLVRDALLGRLSLDIDLTFEGNIKVLSNEINEVFSDIKSTLSNYDTLKFKLSEKYVFDIATFRAEHFNQSSNKLEAVKSDQTHDLMRRDFTVNTAYVPLNQYTIEAYCDFLENEDAIYVQHRFIQCFSTRIAYHHNSFFEDLEDKKIRILHPQSFEEDPTRLLRAIKLMNQLHFSMEDETYSQFLSACTTQRLYSVSEGKLHQELEKLIRSTSWAMNLIDVSHFRMMKSITSEDIIKYLWHKIDQMQIHFDLSPEKVKRLKVMVCFKQDLKWIKGIDPELKVYFREVNQIFSQLSVNQNQLSVNRNQLSNYQNQLSNYQNQLDINPNESGSCYNSLDSDMSLEKNDYNDYKILYNKSIVSILFVALVNEECENRMLRFLKFTSKFAVQIDGDVLLKSGIPTGAEMGRLFETLLKYKIENHLMLSKEDEIKYIVSIKNEY